MYNEFSTIKKIKTQIEIKNAVITKTDKGNSLVVINKSELHHKS